MCFLQLAQTENRDDAGQTHQPQDSFTFGEERMKGGQEHYSGRSPFSGTQEAREKWGPASYLPTTQEQLLPKVGKKAPREPNMNISVISMGKSLLL